MYLLEMEEVFYEHYDVHTELYNMKTECKLELGFPFCIEKSTIENKNQTELLTL